MTTVLTVMMSQLNSPLYVLCELQVFSLVIHGVGGGVIRLSSRVMSVVPLSFFPPLVLSSSSPPPFSSPLTDAPKITNKPDNPNIRLTSGASHTITVRYDQGNPLAMIEWSKDGNPIPGHSITTANGETTLTLINNDPSVNLGGRYRVRVYNNAGEATAMYIVDAECKLL